jgi:diguanylate cyclase (GGDEF)-like protein
MRASRRLFIRFALYTLLPAITLGWLLTGLVRATVERRVLLGSLANYARVVDTLETHVPDAVNVRNLRPEQVRAFDQTLGVLVSRAGQGEVEIVDTTGRIVYSSEPTLIGAQRHVDARQRRAISGHSGASFESGTGVGRVVRFSIPIRSQGRVVRTLEIREPESVATGSMDDDLRKLYAAVFAGLGMFWLAMLPIASGLTRRLAKQAERNHRLAFEDGLTGLANRRSFLQTLAESSRQARARRQRIGLLVIDVDDFKPINDLHGHAVGDVVLAAVGERLRYATREGDTVARTGGDEFAVILPNVGDRATLELVNARIRMAFFEPIEIGGRRLPVSVSVGSALFPDDGDDVHSVLAYADDAMYHAKRARSRRVAPSTAPARVLDIRERLPRQSS